MEQLFLFKVDRRVPLEPLNFHEQTLQKAIDDMRAGREWQGDVLLLIDHLKVSGLRPEFIDQVLRDDMPMIDAYNQRVADRIYKMLTSTQLETNVARSA